MPRGQLPRSPSWALEPSRVRGGGNRWQVLEGSPLERCGGCGAGGWRRRKPVMFTRGGSAPGGVATRMLARQSLCHSPALACAAHGHSHPQTRPHTLKSESTRTHGARTRPRQPPGPRAAAPLPAPSEGLRHLGRRAPQFRAGLPSAACLPLRMSAEKVRGFTTARNDRRSR